MKNTFALLGIAVLTLSVFAFGAKQFVVFFENYHLDNQAAVIVTSDDLTLYNGVNATLPIDPNRSCLENGVEVTEGRNGNNKSLKLTPDAWRSPAIRIACGNQDRLNLSTYNYLEFYIKGNQVDGKKDFNIVSYFGRSNTINILDYVDGKKIDGTWRLVSIPLSVLKTSSYDLGAVDILYFGSDLESRIFYIDDISFKKQKTETLASPSPSTSPTSSASTIILYDGESNSAPLRSASCLSNAEQLSGSGKVGNGLLLKPDPWSAPRFKIYCGGRARLNFSNFDAIEFYIRSDSLNTNNPIFNIVSYFGRSADVRIKDYVENGIIDTKWRLVSIPISKLKTSSYSLDAVDDIYFGTDVSSKPLYLDNLIVTKKRTVVDATPSKYSSAPVAGPVPTVIATQPKTEGPTPKPVPTPTIPLPDPVPPPFDIVVRDEVPVTPIPYLPSGPYESSQSELFDYDEIDLANRFGQWLYTENKDHVSLNFTQPYDTSVVGNTTNYLITSSDDPAYSIGKRPISVGYRWRTIYAPAIRKVDLKVGYRVFLKLQAPLQNGKTYTVQASNLGMRSSSFTFKFDDTQLNRNIKVNQIGYLPTSKKIGYVGQYMGTAGPMPFEINLFEVRNTETGAVVYSGIPRLRNIDTKNTGETVYDLDFSAVQNSGSYYLRVPGVGVSYPFRIGNDIYNEVLGNAVQGVYHQRSGTSLTEDFTRFTHGPAHLNDGYVMDHNPIPEWFRGRFDSQGDTSRRDSSGRRYYFPTTLSGQYINTNKGHYDAGDYGKYVINGALFTGNILVGYDAFPERLMRDDLRIPESGNGIPDLIDEVKWELDWLENMQDHVDGGVFCILKPDGAVEYYENRMPDAPSPSRRLLYPKDTTCTAAYAAALAKASREPLIVKNYPDAAKRYLEKAEKAWGWLENNSGYNGWHHYGHKDEFDTDKSMDERVWAAIELFGATGKDKYHNFFLNKHRPEYIRWGWNTLFEASGQANYACAFMERSSLNSAMKARCQKEIIKSADSHITDSHNRAYRLSMSDAPLDYKGYTYFFPQDRIMQLVVANALTPKAAYLETALYNWDYVLGANPTSYTYVTGIGSKRFREVVSTQSVSDEIRPPVPGLPIGMGNNFGYLQVYGSALGQMFPSNNTYPLLHQIYDGYNIGVEFTVPEISQNLISASYFATIGGSKNKAPESISIEALPSVGVAPLRVQFKATGSDRDGEVVRYFWDFDDETYSTKQNPVHTFKDPYKLYEVVLTVTDNDGAQKHKEILVRTSPSSFPYTPEAYTGDANTIALFHFDSSLSESTGKGYTTKTSGNAGLSTGNVQWMRNPSGKSLAFGTVNDTAIIEIPRKDVFPNAQSTLVVEAKVFAEDFISENVKTANAFVVAQGDERQIGLFDAIYVDGTHLKVMDGYVNQKMLVSRTQLQELMNQGKMKEGTWYNLKFVISPNNSSVYVNSEKIAESNISPNFAASDAPVKILLGGFKGYIDELRLSSVLR